MKFIISIDDERCAAFTLRATTAFQEEQTFTRIAITPENLPTPVPNWWEGHCTRWVHTQAILSALKQAQEAGEDCEIYEDDCIFVDDFARKRAAFLNDLPTGWDMAYFGSQLLAQRFYKLTEVEGHDGVFLCKNVHRTHAFICAHGSIQRVIDWLETPHWEGTQTTDWRLGYLEMQDDFHVYIPKTGWLCGQGSSFSQLDGITYPDRWWHYTEPEWTQELERVNPFYEELAEKRRQAQIDAWKRGR